MKPSKPRLGTPCGMACGFCGEQLVIDTVTWMHVDLAGGVNGMTAHAKNERWVYTVRCEGCGKSDA